MSQNEQLLRRYYDDIVNKGDLSAVDEIVADDYVSHHNDPAHLPPGPAGVKAFISMTRQGFPDIHITVDDLFEEGDLIASRWTMEGTQTGDWFGAPPSGKRAKWWGVVITRFADGKIAEDWYNFDQVSLLQQLGIIPAN
ncbi:MAG: ester cyclase [Chloroflexota bacterium]